MAAIDNLAAFLSGKYQGWIRYPAGEWEDLIGSVDFVFIPHTEDSLTVTITTLEFGLWTGILRLQDNVMKGSTGQGDTYFQFALRERGPAEKAQCRFLGGVFAPAGKQLFEVFLTRY